MRRLFLLVGLCAVPCMHAQDAAPQQIRQLSSQIFDSNDFAIEKPETAQRVRALWRAQEEWVVGRFDESFAPSGEMTRKSLIEISKETGATIHAVDDRTLLVATSINQVGDLFVATRGADGWHVTWRIRDLSTDLPPVRAWKTLGESRCYPAKAQERPGDCIVPSGVSTMRALDAKRIMITTSYMQWMGGTQGMQILVLSHDGDRWDIQLARDYSVYIDQTTSIRVHNPTIHVRVKDTWTNMFACGGCEGRQRDWNFRITSSGIEEAGKVSVVPELDAVDAEIGLALKHRSRLLHVTETGMLMEWGLSRTGDHSELCVSADSFEWPMLFSLHRMKDGYTIDSVKELTNAQSCPADMQKHGF